MTSSLQTQHAAQVGELADRYRRGGYQVIVEPQPSDLPFDLGDYAPDLLAVKSDTRLIVEVKTGADRISLDRLRSVAEEVRRHPGWRFVLVTAQDVTSAEWPGEEDDRLSWGDVAERVDRDLRLNERGDTEAGFLALWIAFERLLRLQARRVALPVDRLVPAIVIRQLYSQGELTMQQFDTALECQKMRNRIVHGFPSADLATAITRLAALVREILAEWSAQSSAD